MPEPADALDLRSRTTPIPSGTLGWAGDPAPDARDARFTLTALAGRLVEITAAGGSAVLTAATGLVIEAQRRREPAAWVGVGGSIVYPPDLAASGVDLAALPLVRVGGAIAAARAADELLRSGGFALVVIDLAGAAGGHVVPLPIQTRLAGLAHKHRAALVCLTRKADAAPSLGALVSLRARGDAMRTAFDVFTCALEITKDKRNGPGWRYTEVCRGPDGLV